MATLIKRQGKRGWRWTARIRRDGRETTKTFATKAAAETWARAQETAIESGEYTATHDSGSPIFADLVDEFTKHRLDTNKRPGNTFANALSRLKEAHGLEPASTLTAQFWRRYALDRMRRDGVTSQTVASDLAYASSVLSHARREGRIADASGPAQARQMLKDDGLRVVSRQREGRISDADLKKLLAACDAIPSSIPLGDIVRFALATSMRRGEILRITWADLDAKNRIVLVRGRTHPRDQERVDEVPLLRAHPKWPLWDALEVIERQPRGKGERVFPFLDDSVGERFEAACEAAKLTGIVFHLMRHESLSRYAERGLDALRLQIVGGHRDLRYVARYARLSARGLAAEL